MRVGCAALIADLQLATEPLWNMQRFRSLTHCLTADNLFSAVSAISDLQACLSLAHALGSV